MLSEPGLPCQRVPANWKVCGTKSARKRGNMSSGVFCLLLLVVVEGVLVCVLVYAVYVVEFLEFS